jgi:cell pole-organizing protein PopZ
MQGWLDDKLPPVVKQVVRAELARAFREGATTVQRATDP